MDLTIDDIRNIIVGRDWTRSIGCSEGFHLDAKEQIYVLENDAKKLELAKDVSAFANARGGYILVGARTIPNPSHRGEEISELRPFRQSLFDVARHLNVLRDWIYPPILDLGILWEPETDGAERGFGLITVPPQDDRKPFLIKKSALEASQKLSHVIFGYAERKGDQTDWFTVENLYQFLRDGFNYQQTIRDRLDRLQEAIDNLQTASSGAGVRGSLDEAEVRRRLDRIVKAALTGGAL